MSISKPFHRNYRGFVKGKNSGYNEWAYIVDRGYSDSPEHYIRAFLLIQGDLRKLFEYVEPSDCNLSTYSYRIHELFMRTCIEIESNFKAILKENIYSPVDKKKQSIPEKKWNIHNYKIINKTHHLSSYKVHVPIWDGEKSTFTPFDSWVNNAELEWYQAYNKSKHDRKVEFRKANFENLLCSVAALLIVLSSQFRTEDFSPGSDLLEVTSDSYYSTEPALGGFFHIDFPDDWNQSELYNFNWSELKNQQDRFQKIDYNKLK